MKSMFMLVWSMIRCYEMLLQSLLSIYLCCVFSAADWRYAAQQFVKRLPDKVIVHRKSFCFMYPIFISV